MDTNSPRKTKAQPLSMAKSRQNEDKTEVASKG